MASDPERLPIAAIKAGVVLSEVVGRYVELRRVNGELAGLCPFHGERTPSFTVVDRKGFAHCFGCGWHGDVLDFLMAIERIDIAAAMERLGGDGLPAPDPETLARRKREREAFEARERETKRRAALSLWKDGETINGTLAAAYLEQRGLKAEHGEWPGSLRHVAAVRHPATGDPVPTLMAGAARWPGRDIMAVQLTALAPPGVKADVDPVRWSRGHLAGSAVRLSPWSGATRIVLTEGVEDGLAVLRAVPGVAVGAVLGAWNAAKVELPEGAEIVLALDADTAGDGASDKAARALIARGFAVRRACLPAGHDPNSLLLDGGA